MDEFFPMEKDYIIETMTMRLIPNNSEPTTMPTAMFWLSRNGNKYAFWLLEKVIKKGCLYLLPIPRS